MTHQVLPNPPGVSILTDSALAEVKMRLGGDISRYVPDLGGCPTCGGLGRFRWYDESNEIVDWECDCVSQWEAFAYLLYCGMPSSTMKWMWRDADGVEPGILAGAKNWLQGARPRVEYGRSLVFHGGSNVGKTLLATLMVKHLAGYGYHRSIHAGVERRTGFNVCVTNIEEMTAIYAGSWKNEDRKRVFDGRIKGSEVLFIDELNASKLATDNSFRLVSAMLIETLRHRLQYGLSTVITTPFSREKIDTVLTPEVGGLLAEACGEFGFVDFGGYARTAPKNPFDTDVERGLRRPIEVVCPGLEADQ